MRNRRSARAGSKPPSGGGRRRAGLGRAAVTDAPGGGGAAVAKHAPRERKNDAAPAPTDGSIQPLTALPASAIKCFLSH